MSSLLLTGVGAAASTRDPALVLELLGTSGRFTDTGATTPAGVGNTVAAWRDLGGANYTATQAASTQRPIASTLGLTFDGTDDRVLVPDAAPLRLDYGMAVELWVLRSGTGFYYPLSKDNFSAGGRDWGMSVDGTTAEFYAFNAAGTQYFGRHTSGSSQSGVWNYIVGVLHAAGSGGVRIYVNGVLGGIAGSFSGSLPSTTQPLTIGSTGVGTAVYSGQMGTLRVRKFGVSGDPGAAYWLAQFNAEKAVYGL